MKNNKRIIIGLVGPIGCGKGAVSNYLHKKYDFHVITMGDIIREELKKRNLEITRENSYKMQAELRGKNPHYLINSIVKKINENLWEKVVIDGIRYPHQAMIPKKIFGKEFKLLLIDASPEIRYKRLVKRGREDKPESYDDFLNQEKKENEIFNLKKTYSLADEKIINEGTLLNLYKKIDKILEKEEE